MSKVILLAAIAALYVTMSVRMSVYLYVQSSKFNVVGTKVLWHVIIALQCDVLDNIDNNIDNIKYIDDMMLTTLTVLTM